jgi:hypothetical protein
MPVEDNIFEKTTLDLQRIKELTILFSVCTALCMEVLNPSRTDESLLQTG